MTQALLECCVAMKQSPKLVKQVLEDLNGDEAILSEEEFAHLIAKNQCKGKCNEFKNSCRANGKSST